MNNGIINENLDLRVRRMHKLLFDALISLLTEKTLMTSAFQISAIRL